MNPKRLFWETGKILCIFICCSYIGHEDNPFGIERLSDDIFFQSARLINYSGVWTINSFLLISLIDFNEWVNSSSIFFSKNWFYLFKIKSGSISFINDIENVANNVFSLSCVQKWLFSMIFSERDYNLYPNIIHTWIYPL